MRKIIILLFILLTVPFSIIARNHNGCYSYSQRGGFNHDKTCRVVGEYSYCDDYSGIYIQFSPGMAVRPNFGFEGLFGVGRKFPSGMTLGVSLRGGYDNVPSASVALSTAYEFTALRKYTDIFYPILGAEFGFGGRQVDDEKHWDALPYVGYKAGFRFACIRGKFDIGLEYSGNYNFAISGLAKKSKNFLNHSLALTLCAYIP